ncbi:MAG: hypothetical protein PHW04_10910 [Candidatus Wallbacteria bacterium]|nr:hypothetical protein [Candidatus Wallbacteria bacterium]
MQRILILVLILPAFFLFAQDERKILEKIFNPFQQEGLNSLDCEMKVNFSDPGMAELSGFMPRLILSYKKGAFNLSYKLPENIPDQMKTLVQPLLEKMIGKTDFADYNAGLAKLQTEYSITGISTVETGTEVAMKALSKNEKVQKLLIRIDKQFRVVNAAASGSNLSAAITVTYRNEGKFVVFDNVSVNAAQDSKAQNFSLKYENYRINQ